MQCSPGGNGAWAFGGGGELGAVIFILHDGMVRKTQLVHFIFVVKCKNREPKGNALPFPFSSLTLC